MPNYDTVGLITFLKIVIFIIYLSLSKKKKISSCDEFSYMFGGPKKATLSLAFE